jgi:ABC-type sugar transport system ATPase subunit
MSIGEEKLQEYIMLELQDVKKSFGDVEVLNGINLRLEEDFVYTLKGGNGSGKTTLIKIIFGFLALLGTMTIQNTQLVKSNK